MEQKKHNIAFTAAKIAVTMAIFVLIAYFISILSGFSPFFDESAHANAKRDVRADSENVTEIFGTHFTNLYAIAEELTFAKSKEEIDEKLGKHIGMDEFGDLRYFTNGVEYAANGLMIENEEASAITALGSSIKPACTTLYFDEAVSMDCIAIYVPIKGSEYIDGLVGILQARGCISLEGYLNENASTIAFISTDGMIMASAQLDTFEYSLGNNLYDFIRRESNDSVTASAMREDVASGEVGSGIITFGGVEYVYACSPVANTDGNFSILTLSRTTKITEAELDYVTHLMYVLVIAITFLLITLIYTIIFHHRLKQESKNAALHDAVLECANEEAFRRKCIEIQAEAPTEKHALFTMQIKQFHFVQTKLGVKNTTEILKFASDVINNFCNEHETYGYAGDGTFLLFHYFKNESNLKNRIQVLTAIINKCPTLTQNNTTVGFISGVCFDFGIRKRTMREIIDCAYVATESAKSKSHLPYVLYSESVNQEIIRQEQLENEMEQALESSDFKVL